MSQTASTHRIEARRLASAWTQVMVVAALVASTSALVLMIGGAALAG
jgi:hypothetical protein